MLSELDRRTFFAAAAAFLVALAVAYALSSTGQASETSGAPGSPAAPLDVASGIAGNSSLGDAAGLPAMAKRPKPPPPPDVDDEPADVPDPAPTAPAPTYEPPAYEPPVTQAPAPPPAQEPEVFDDSG